MRSCKAGSVWVCMACCHVPRCFPIMQGLEAGQAEARASVKAMQAEKAEVEGRLHVLEDKLEALEQENASLESMKVGPTQAYHEPRRSQEGAIPKSHCSML